MFFKDFHFRATMFSPVLRKLSLAVAVALFSRGELSRGATVSPASSLPAPPPAASTDPAAAPALVPEGVLAMRLLAALNLGSTGDPAEAEHRLSATGIEPAKGWNSEYPVTPAIMGEIIAALKGAAQSGRVSMDQTAAVKVLADLAKEMGLPVAEAPTEQPPPKPETVEVKIYRYVDHSGGVHLTNRYTSIPEEFKSSVTLVRSTVKPVQPPSPPIVQAPVPAPGAIGEDAGNEEVPVEDDSEANPEAFDDSGYDEGPPPLTYYPPPMQYRDLYGWQAYPFWYSGLYFPGFYVLHHFHRRVHYGSQNFAVNYHDRHFRRGPSFRAGGQSNFGYGSFASPGGFGRQGSYPADLQGGTGSFLGVPSPVDSSQMPFSDRRRLGPVYPRGATGPVFRSHPPFRGARFPNVMQTQPNFPPGGRAGSPQQPPAYFGVPGFRPNGNVGGFRRQGGFAAPGVPGGPGSFPARGGFGGQSGGSRHR